MTLALDEGLRRLEVRKAWAAGLLIATAVGFIGLAGGELLQLLGLVDVNAAYPDTLTGLVGVGAIGALIAMVSAMIAVCFWTHRAHANLAEAGYDKEFSPGSAIGWYFVPFANLVMPFRAMRELWNLSHAQVDANDAPAPALLVPWWSCWIAGNIASNIGSRLESTSGSVGFTIELLGSLMLAVAAWFLRDIVIRITAAQRSVVGVSEAFA